MAPKVGRQGGAAWDVWSAFVWGPFLGTFFEVLYIRLAKIATSPWNASFGVRLGVLKWTPR